MTVEGEAMTSGADVQATILVVDDSRTIRRILSNALVAGGYTVLQAGNGQEGLDVCRAEHPDLVLLDIDMPVLNGLDTMRAMQSDPELAVIPVLFLTARTSGSDVAEGLGLGARDYLRKPCESSELLARVQVALARRAAEAALARKAQELDDLSTTDQLTALGNRRRWQVAVSELAARHNPDLPIALAMIDIDRFKVINDTMGHLDGDTVLTLVARRLRGAAHDEDTLVRWGGEEFLLLRVSSDTDSIAATAEEMRASVCRWPLAVGVDRVVEVTISVGWAAGVLADLDGLLALVDERLYAAKGAGRNCVVGAPA